MTDSVKVFNPGYRVLDSSGDPVSGAKLKFYDAGTTSARTVYTDEDLSVSAGTEVTCNSAGIPQVSSADVLIYTGTTDYKVVITDSDDVTITSHDNISGALDTSGFVTTAAAITMPVVSKAGDYSIASTDMGQLFSVDSSSATVTLSLPAAGTAGDGSTFGVVKTDASNTVVLDGSGGETINGSTTYSLSTNRSAIILVTDGSEWFIVAEFDGT